MNPILLTSSLLFLGALVIITWLHNQAWLDVRTPRVAPPPGGPLISVIVPARNGTTQIDHVVVSPYGIFVVETKNYKGWIFGSADQAQWTQSIYGKKNRFQNPLRQNYRHIKCLSDYLDLPEDRFHSVVFFIGDCKLKTDLPANVMTSGLSGYIKRQTSPILDQHQLSFYTPY